MKEKYEEGRKEERNGGMAGEVKKNEVREERKEGGRKQREEQRKEKYK